MGEKEVRNVELESTFSGSKMDDDDRDWGVEQGLCNIRAFDASLDAVPLTTWLISHFM